MTQTIWSKFLEDFAQAFEADEATKEGPLQELSELTLGTSPTGELMLSFDTLGQDFVLTPGGIFTSDQLGTPQSLKPSFSRALEGYLSWRLSVLNRFGL